jgi:hypothetical protein
MPPPDIKNGINNPDRNFDLSKLSGLSFDQQVLCFGGVFGKKDATIDYQLDRDGNRINKNHIYPNQLRHLADTFKNNPKDFQAYCRENLMRIKLDPKQTPEANRERHKRYVDKYLDLILALDRTTYPPSDQVFREIPEYIPDGLSDMGSDPNPHDALRSREKIRIDKQEILEKAKLLFYELLSIDPTKANSEQIKQYIVTRVAHFVYTEMPYDYKGEFVGHMGNSVPMSVFQEKRLAVCRHHALVTQVLLQSFGITSRLMKSDVSFTEQSYPGAHANNLVRINKKWYLLDTTNPGTNSNGVGEVFLKPLPQSNIDVNRDKFTWQIPDGKGVRTYIMRNNMNYRIRDNVQNPAH